MTKLHLISQPIILSQFEIEMARMMTTHDEILFIGDAVISLMDKNIVAYIQQAKIRYYALAADCLCRGIGRLLNQSVEQISDSEMVDLTLEHQQIISW